MSNVIISIQHGDPRKQTYLRKEIGTMHKGSVLKAVEELLDDQEAHTLGKLTTQTFRRGGHNRKTLPVIKPDDETIPGA
jgi:hypothetical protein